MPDPRPYGKYTLAEAFERLRGYEKLLGPERRKGTPAEAERSDHLAQIQREFGDVLEAFQLRSGEGGGRRDTLSADAPDELILALDTHEFMIRSDDYVVPTQDGWASALDDGQAWVSGYRMAGRPMDNPITSDHLSRLVSEVLDAVRIHETREQTYAESMGVLARPENLTRVRFFPHSLWVSLHEQLQPTLEVPGGVAILLDEAETTKRLLADYCDRGRVQPSEVELVWAGGLYKLMNPFNLAARYAMCRALAVSHASSYSTELSLWTDPGTSSGHTRINVASLAEAAASVLNDPVTRRAIRRPKHLADALAEASKDWDGSFGVDAWYDHVRGKPKKDYIRPLLQRSSDSAPWTEYAKDNFPAFVNALWAASTEYLARHNTGK